MNHLIRIFFGVFLIFLLTLIIAEVSLRSMDIPGIDKNTHYTIDPLVGYGDIPYARLLYRNNRGDIVQRTFNSFGCLDAEHKKEKGKSIYRIGFFGDSYVEARQVPLEKTFFRIIEEKLDDNNVECLAFGRESGGTLVAYLNNTRWSPYFDLDLIIHVFCENDPGDNIKEIKEKTAPYFPFAFLGGDGYGIDYTNRDRFIRYGRTPLYKIKKFISNHLLVSKVIKSRMQLLIDYGVRSKASEEYKMMATKSGKNRIPDQNDLPSSWPADLRRYAEKLASLIILKWRDEALADSRGFAILYIPRPGEMEKETHLQDSWKPWLESFCKKENIGFIDSTQDLIKTQRSGREIFYDHFTVYGNSSLALTFVRWFKEDFLK